MTYCVAIIVNEGIAFCSDSRTSAGVDQINTYAKMFRFGVDGERQFVILSAGNLATTQAVISKVSKDIEHLQPVNLNTVADLEEAAEYLGQVNVAVQNKTPGGIAYNATFLIGGQISGCAPQLAMVYPEGNYITAPRETPFLQIGESKYGKPILDRIIRPETNLGTAAVCALVSMDSTVRSNLTVGPPIDLQLYHTDSFAAGEYYHLRENSEFLKLINRSWNDRMLEAFSSMPSLESAELTPQP